MEIISSTVIGVQSAVRRLELDDQSPTYLILPMIHIAEQGFYDEVTKRLQCCDIILVEGVKSTKVGLLSASYRYAAVNPKLNMVLQSTMNLDELKGKIIHADVSSKDFDNKWSKLPLVQRLALPILAPLFGLYLRFFGTREHFAKHSTFNMKMSQNEILDDGETLPEFKEMVVDWRDEHLLEIVKQTKTCGSDIQPVIGIVYGAHHMRAVLYFLVRQMGYRITQSEWLTAFRV